MKTVSSENSEKIDIILPSRIGDSILSIPVIVCLEQLNRKYNSGHSIRILARPYLVKLFSSTGLFKCKGMNFIEKCRSFLFPADRAFFIETTNDNWGYFSKESYGITNPFKNFLKFTQQPDYLWFSYDPSPEIWQGIKSSFPEQLINFLIDECRLSWYSAGLFGICLELGYAEEQVIDTFDLNVISSVVERSQEIPPLPPVGRNDYIVFCIEAGYGRKHLNERCWDIDDCFKIAEKCAEDFGIKCVFVGTDTDTSLPEREYIEDLRGKITLYDLARVMKSAVCYIGNDTGPVHVANLMNTPSVSLYFKKEIMTGFSPVFSDINTKILRPENVEQVYSEVVRVLTPTVQKSLSAQSPL